MKKPQTFMIDLNLGERLKLVQIEMNKTRPPSTPVTSISDLVNDAIRIHLDQFPLNLEALFEEINREEETLKFYRIAKGDKDFVNHLCNLGKVNGMNRLADRIRPCLKEVNWENVVSSEIDKMLIELHLKKQELQLLTSETTQV